MRTNIDIDDTLMAEAMAELGVRTKREAVEKGLRDALMLVRQKGIRRLRGRVDWIGDLDEMRRD